MKDYSFSIVCPNGHAIYRDGAIINPSRPSEPGVPIGDVIVQLVADNQLSLNDLLKAVQGEYYNSPGSLRREIGIAAKPHPVVILESDKDACVRLLNEERMPREDHRPNPAYFFINFLIQLAPERLEANLREEDWEMFGRVDEGFGPMYGGRLYRARFSSEALDVLGRLRPELVKGWLDEDEKRFWDSLPKALDDARQSYGDIDDDAEEHEHSEAHGLLCAIEPACRRDRARAVASLSDDDRAAIARYVEYLERSEHTWRVVRALSCLHALEPERALQALATAWPKHAPKLVERRDAFRDMIRTLLAGGTSFLNGDGPMSELCKLFMFSPERTLEICQAEDWLLLSAVTEHRRMRGSDLQLVAHLECMLQWQPLYAHLFVSI